MTGTDMPGSPVKIGPFTGGLNTYSDSSSIADTECGELINFDVDLDGSLVNRPPIGIMPSGSGAGGNVLGTYTSTTGLVYFVIADRGDVVRAFDTTSANPAYTITTGVKCTSIVQYQNKLWVIATVDSANPGGSWDPVAGFVAIPTMARGFSGAMYKERLFIATGSGSTPSRLNFSGPANLSSWTSGTDFLDVNNGDGQAIVKITSFNGMIVVFKGQSTYTFGYDSQPTKGQVQLVNATIGIASLNAFAEYENVMYVLHGNYLYAIQNFNWDQINVKVPFKYYNFKTRTTWQDFSLSIIGNRLVCRYYDNFYIYGLKTRAISQWLFTDADFSPSHFIRYPIFDTQSNLPVYMAGSYDTIVGNWYKMVDTPISTISESFTLKITTKTYDYNVPYSFKRLHYWGVDILAKSTLTFLVHPTVYNVPLRWSQLAGVRWALLKTWARPIDVSIDVSDSATSTNPSGVRTFIKLLKSLRFRQISFRLTSVVNGTSATGPLRLFSMTAMTSSKQLVSKKIS